MKTVNDLRHELEVVTKLATDAGALLMASRASGLEIRYKGVDDPVTQADIAADT
ncbi:MAG: hypothetical protein HC933_22840 [Pleurocapsa sp. SU_196_0]|nr:hypothetical protein [Pleurocapsa sp. SU_196_0]